MTRERLTFGHPLHGAVPPRAIAAAAPADREPAPVRLSRPETWDWGWGGLLIFTILLFFRPQDELPGLQNSHVSDIAALIGLAAMVSLNISRGRPLTRMTPELAGVLALGAVIAVTIPTSFWQGGAFDTLINTFLPIALIFMLMVNSMTSPKRVERICWVIVLAFGYMSARVIFNYMRGVGVMMGDRATGPVGGFFSNPNDLALNLAAFLPLALIIVKRPGPAWKRMLCAGIGVLMLVAMVFTKSRSGTLGTVAMLVTFAFMARVITPGVILGVVLAGVLALPALPDTFWDRMASITDGSKDDTGSRRERRLLLDQAWTVFLENPLTGVGAGQFRNYYRPGLATRWHEAHNVLLQVGAEIGIFGLAIFLFLVARGFSAAWWTRRQLSWIYRKRSRTRAAPPEPEDGLTPAERGFLETHSSALVACLVGWLVCALFASVAFNWTFYYLLGLAATARDVVRTRELTYARAKAHAVREASAA